MATSIAVIIPARNSARYIGETLKSVLAQTRPADEIVLADGASTDDTVRIAKSLAPGIKIISEPNAGAADGRNQALRLASSEWLAFMDSDDLWHPEKLRMQSQLIEKAPEVEFLFSDVWQFRDEQILSKSFLATRPGYPKLSKHAVAPESYVFDTDMSVALMHTNYVVTSSEAMVKRSAALEVGGFDPTLRVCEDYDFWMRVLKGRKAGVVEVPLVGYRHHGESLSDDTESMVRGRLEVAARVFANPERYPMGAPAFFKQEKARRYVQLGRMELHRDKFSQARANFWQSFRLVPKPSTAALLGSSLLGSRGRDTLLTIKRALGKKG